jgi:phytoene/squalene synthetase
MPVNKPSSTNAAVITRAASSQTYYTILFLADRGRVANGFRAYGYFRWLDDQLDEDGLKRQARLDLVERQIQIMRSTYAENMQEPVHSEEKILVDLIRSDTEENSGLKRYVRDLMAVMEFDVQRRGKLITAAELEDYSLKLSRAVTEAMHYFIGHDKYSPKSDLRYQAVIGAHVTHMLRDTLDDIRSGYYNIPQEYLEKHSITPRDINSEPYRAWVEDRVSQAHASFKAGREYLANVESFRFRMAALAYMKRFEKILGIIEKDHYYLRPVYEKVFPFKEGNRFNLGWLGMPEFSSTKVSGSRMNVVNNRVVEKL